jgi:hypothetical protein
VNSIKLFWGTVILTLGSLLIATNQGFLDNTIWWKALSLWPVTLVVLGLRLLIKNERVLATMVVTIILLSVAFIIFVDVQPYGLSTNKENFMGMKFNSQVYSEALTGEYDTKSIKGLNFTINTGAAKVNLGVLPAGTKEGTLYIVKTKDMGKLAVVRNINNERASIIVEEENVGFHIGPKMMIDREINIYLPEKLLTNLTLNSGASKLNIDLNSISIESLDLDAGASSIVISLSKISTNQSINLKAGASDISFLVRTGICIKATLEGGLNNIKSDSNLNIIKSGNSYIASDFDTCATKVNILGNTGVSSIKFSSE